MTCRNTLYILLLQLLSLPVFAGTGQLYLLDQYLVGEQITDMCIWKNSLWASTSKGLYQVKDDEVIEIPISIRENDRITSLHNGSPYTLICGTFDGDLVFVTQDQSDFCQAVWSLKEKEKTPSYYVNSVSQGEEGIWLGTLEHGIYLYRPKLDSMQNFSLDFNEEDSLGLNVYDVFVDKNDKTWVVAQDGLYLIMNIFGKDGALQYVKSHKVKYRPIELDFNDEQTYIAFKRKGNHYVGRAYSPKTSFDIRIRERKKLPVSDIRGLDAKSAKDFWLLSERLYHSKEKAWIEYPLVNKDREAIEPVDLVVHKDAIWISSERNGLLKYSLTPEEEEIPSDESYFSSDEIAFDKALELNLVYFSPGDSTLLQTSYGQLNELASYLEQDSSVNVELQGHTAKDGDETFLSMLSSARARSVQKFLLEKGIAQERIVVLGMGAEKLKDPEHPKSPKNRRVEIILSR